MNMKELLKSLVAAGVLTVLSLGSAWITGCQLTPTGIDITGFDYVLPKYEFCKLLDSHRLLLKFSAPVTVSTVRLALVGAEDTVNSEEVSASADESVPVLFSFMDETEKMSGEDTVFTQEEMSESGEIVLNFARPLERGQQYVLSAVAEDEKGNTVHFSTVLYGYNENPAKLVLSELRTNYSNPKCEFIELYAVESGNLSGMILESVYGTKQLRYQFPDVDVQGGEYIVVHLRTLSEECFDETGDDLNACTFKDASATGRDLWREGSEKMVGTTGVILLYNRMAGDIVDALCYSESGKESWISGTMAEAAEKAAGAGIWISGDGAQSAVCSEGMTTTRTLCRQNIELLETDGTGELQYPYPVQESQWFVVATGKGTPGGPNSSTAYQ